MKKKLLAISISICTAVLMMVLNVSAENRKGAISLTPMIGGYVFDGAQDINSDLLYAIGLGYNLTERFGIEGVFSRIDTDMKGPDRTIDVDSMISHVDGLYHFMPESDVVPYIGAGLGYIDIESDRGENHSSWLGNYGAGVKVAITESLAARGDVRHLVDFDGGNSNLAYTLGLTMLFGGKTEQPPMDSDGDGVTDDMDKCPGTPAGVAVDSKGCPLDSDGDGVTDDKDKCPGTPAGAAVNSSGCPLDSDGDGVYDYLDKCPRTPAGAAVNKAGCPLDSDGDGVYDYLDKCPGTLKGISVDSVGCPIPIKEKVSIELKVEFALNSAVVTSIYQDHIQKVANFLKTYPDTIAEIEGHTDSTGSDQYNMSLSQKRAESVIAKIRNLGVSPSRLKAIGYGESRPIADNKTKEGRQRNRRVVALIVTIVTK